MYAKYALHLYCSDQSDLSYQITIFQHGEQFLSVLQASLANFKNLAHKECLVVEPLSNMRGLGGQ